jgi:formate hydrogenlyase subunit 4
MITTILLDALQYLGYILIFPGFLFCFVVGLLLCGIDRKLVARMQKRVGPPILQPFYDFFKLMGKETIVPAQANRTVFLVAPLLGLAALVVVMQVLRKKKLALHKAE